MCPLCSLLLALAQNDMVAYTASDGSNYLLALSTDDGQLVVTGPIAHDQTTKPAYWVLPTVKVAAEAGSSSWPIDKNFGAAFKYGSDGLYFAANGPPGVHTPRAVP